MRRLLCWGACVALAVCGCGGAPAQTVQQPARSQAFHSLAQLMPADLDALIRLDWRRMEREDYDSYAHELLKSLHFPEPLWQQAQDCARGARALWLGMRLGDRGLDGDTVIVIEDADAKLADKCAPKGWREVGRVGHIQVFGPPRPEQSRGKLAMAIASDRDWMLVSPGQADAVLRVLRNGPDAHRLEAPDEALVGLAARLDERRMPQAWRRSHPNLVLLGQGLVLVRGKLDVRDQLGVQLSLQYEQPHDAEQAGKRLQQLRRAMLESGKAAARNVLQSAHAQIAGELLTITVGRP